MLTNLKGSVAALAGAIILAIIGSETFLAYTKVVAGSTVVETSVLILGALGVGAGAHIGASAVTTSQSTVQAAATTAAVAAVAAAPSAPAPVPPVAPSAPLVP
jgi:hypothetical protein